MWSRCRYGEDNRLNSSDDHVVIPRNEDDYDENYNDDYGEDDHDVIMVIL